MMLSLLWYYRPEHLERPNPEDLPDEVYASRHRDTTSVACIEDRCYVMTFNEYCRLVTVIRFYRVPVLKGLVFGQRTGRNQSF